jgi:hypothetical protein
METWNTWTETAEQLPPAPRTDRALSAEAKTSWLLVVLVSVAVMAGAVADALPGVTGLSGVAG